MWKKLMLFSILQEIIIRTSLETQRLELVSEISNMKLHQAAYERENLELRDKIRHGDHQPDNAKMQVSRLYFNLSKLLYVFVFFFL